MVRLIQWLFGRLNKDEQAAPVNEVRTHHEENIMVHEPGTSGTNNGESATVQRRLGILQGKATAVFEDDFEMTEEEFIGLYNLHP